MLSIDATVRPARAVVARVEGSRVRVVEQFVVSFPEVLPSIETDPEDPASLDVGSPADKGLPHPPPADTRFAESAPPPWMVGHNGSPHTSHDTPSTVDADHGVPLAEMLRDVQTPFERSVLIIDPKDYLSISLDSPFRDPKALAKVIDLEVQDIVPFDVSDLLLHSRIVGAIDDTRSDVHISAIPREQMKSILGECRAAGFEPAVVSTPSSAAAGLFLLEPERAQHDSAVVLATPTSLCITLLVEGKIRSDRVIPIHHEGLQWILTEIRLSIAAAERRYGRRIEKLYVLGSGIPRECAIAFSQEVLFIEEPEDGISVAALAALFAVERAPMPILTNFRTREFAYNPYLKPLLQAAIALLPYLIILLLAVAVTAAGVYAYRNHLLTVTKQTIAERVRRAVPSIRAPEGLELKALQGEKNKLETQLKDFGSSSRLAPVDVILELSKHLPPTTDIMIRRLSIEGNNLTIDGVAPDYSAVERLERVFRTNKNIYCRFRKTSGSGVAGQPDKRGFGFELRLCD